MSINLVSPSPIHLLKVKDAKKDEALKKLNFGEETMSTTQWNFCLFILKKRWKAR